MRTASSPRCPIIATPWVSRDVAHRDTRRRPTGRNDERGVSLSLLVTCLVPMLILLVGFVVDSAHRSADARRVAVVAAQAARAGSDASAAARLTGSTGAEQAVSAARAVLAREGVQGDVQLGGGLLQVHTHATTSTMFLQLVGIDHFDEQADATSALVRA